MYSNADRCVMDDAIARRSSLNAASVRAKCCFRGVRIGKIRVPCRYNATVPVLVRFSEFSCCCKILFLGVSLWILDTIATSDGFVGWNIQASASIVMTGGSEKKHFFRSNSRKPQPVWTKVGRHTQIMERQRSGYFSAIGPVGKMGDSGEFCPAGFFFAKSDEILSTSQRPIFTKFGHDA